MRAFWRPQDTSALGGAATNESLLRLFPERAFFCFRRPQPFISHSQITHYFPRTRSRAAQRVCLTAVASHPMVIITAAALELCIRFSRASSTPSLSSLTSLQFKIFISARKKWKRNRRHHPQSSTIPRIQRPLAEAPLPSFNLQPGGSGAQQERQQQERGATAHHKHAAAARCNLFINELHCVQQLQNTSERHSMDIHRMQLLAHVTYTAARSACTLTHCRG